MIVKLMTNDLNEIEVMFSHITAHDSNLHSGESKIIINGEAAPQISN